MAKLQGLRSPVAHGLGRPCPLGLGVSLPPPGVAHCSVRAVLALPPLSGPPSQAAPPQLPGPPRHPEARPGFRLSWAPASFPPSLVLGLYPLGTLLPGFPDGPPSGPAAHQPFCDSKPLSRLSLCLEPLPHFAAPPSLPLADAFPFSSLSRYPLESRQRHWHPRGCRTN